MLVLSRKVNETILVGEATITVCRIGENVVSLGIDAPGMAIRRGELPPRSPLDMGPSSELPVHREPWNND